MDPGRFRALLGDRFDEVEAGIARAGELFAGRVIWHVNSTARGGGVVELLTSLLAYARGAGVDTRWVVIDGDPDFFRVTKRIHNNLHGFAGDGGALGPAEREIYEATAARNAAALAALMRPGDVAYLHDPQTAGLIEAVQAAGAIAVWRCHVGLDLPNDLARAAWEFLRSYVSPADAYVFSRREFAWDGLAEDRIWTVPPSIDAFSAKNEDLDPVGVAAILGVAGLGPRTDDAPLFRRQDGSRGRVDRAAELIEEASLDAGTPLVTQVSRWDRLKDPAGLVSCFTDHLLDTDADLLLAGPSVSSVADDPEGAEVLEEVREQRAALPEEIRRRVHLAALPMDDVDENAAIVNAIQRRSSVVVQKSIAEGFGLTVAEAMWKARPVVASRRGGIQDQIGDGETGVLIDDPLDLAAFGDAIAMLLADRELAERMGAAARERVRERFLGTQSLLAYLRLLDKLLDGSERTTEAGQGARPEAGRQDEP
jgi:trehalose synthase